MWLTYPDPLTLALTLALTLVLMVVQWCRRCRRPCVHWPYSSDR